MALTPAQRVSSAINGEKPDKLPIVVINSNTFTCLHYGITIDEYISDPQKCADVHIRFIQDFGIDCAMVAAAYIFYGTGPEMGVQWEFVDGNFPGAVKGPVESEGDLSGLQVPSEPSGYFKTYVETIKLVHQALGETHYLTANLIGPFTVACFLRGIEETLIDTLMNPELFEKLMAFSTDFSVYAGKAIRDITGLHHPILNEIFLAPEMIRPDVYHEQIAPYDNEVQKRLGPVPPPNSFAFMGNPGDHQSQKIAVSLNQAFFGVGESLEAIKDATRGSEPAGYPFPVGVSGRALNSWNIDRILSYLKEAIDFLISEKRIYPSINLPSVQTDTPRKAEEMVDKLNAINEFRKNYTI
jgi:Uroporphyrinogen decarboxylase (URO-D)